MIRLATSVAMLAALLAASAPARADDDAAKREAKALLREGNRLLQDAHDPRGALELFVSAYAKFPSTKILLSIGSAERELGHLGPAANAYARFLASPDATGDQAKEARKLLADLDKKLGRVALTVTPAEAELQLGDGRWEPASALAEWRAAPGPLTIHARSPGHVDGEVAVTVVVGQVATTSLALAVTPATPIEIAPPPPDDDPEPITPAAASVGRFGVRGKLVVDGKGRGAGGVIGGVVGLGPLALDVAAIVGPTFGAYGGLHLGIGGGRLRPTVGVGMPVFFDDGARFGARAAGGLEYRMTAHVRMSLELGAEYMFTRATDIERWLLAPALAAEARL